MHEIRPRTHATASRLLENMFGLSRKKIIIGLTIILLGIGIFLAIKFFKGREEVIEQPEGPPSVAERLTNKPTLSFSGEALKQKLIQPLGGPGLLYETPDFRIDWLPAPVDSFEVMVKTTDVISAKEEATAWFKGKGFTEEDICALPAIFYLSWEVNQQLRNSGFVFNSLPDFCLY